MRTKGRTLITSRSPTRIVIGARKALLGDGDDLRAHELVAFSGRRGLVLARIARGAWAVTCSGNSAKVVSPWSAT